MIFLFLSLIQAIQSGKKLNPNYSFKRNDYFSKYEESAHQSNPHKHHKPPYFAKTIKIIKPSLDNKNVPGKESTPYWQDIDTVAVNKEKPRTSFVSFDDVESALKYVTGNYNDKSPYYQCLNGKWRFYYVEYPRDLPDGITDKDVDPYGKGWSDITVPRNWDLQGYGIAMYTNVQYDFNPKNPLPPNLPDFIPIGVYYRNFTVPQSWIDSNREIYLQVGGAKTGLYVYMNGIEVGYK